MTIEDYYSSMLKNSDCRRLKKTQGREAMAGLNVSHSTVPRSMIQGSIGDTSGYGDLHQKIGRV